TLNRSRRGARLFLSCVSRPTSVVFDDSFVVDVPDEDSDVELLPASPATFDAVPARPPVDGADGPLVADLLEVSATTTLLFGSTLSLTLSISSCFHEELTTTCASSGPNTRDNASFDLRSISAS